MFEWVDRDRRPLSNVQCGTRENRLSHWTSRVSVLLCSCLEEVQWMRQIISIGASWCHRLLPNRCKNDRSHYLLSFTFIESIMIVAGVRRSDALEDLIIVRWRRCLHERHKVSALITAKHISKQMSSPLSFLLISKRERDEKRSHPHSSSCSSFLPVRRRRW